MSQKTAEDFFNEGLAKGNLSDYHGAIADYDQAIKLDPNFAAAYNNRGLVWQYMPLVSQEKRDRAVDDFNMALVVSDGEYVSALEELRGYQDSDRVKKLYNQRISFVRNWMEPSVDMLALNGNDKNYYVAGLQSG